MIRQRGCSVAAYLDRKIDSHNRILFIEYIILIRRPPFRYLIGEIFMRPYILSACPSS